MPLPPTRFPLLIVSIGNPILKNTPRYHDAGHVLLAALRRRDLPSNWTLWSSGSFMNVCGKGVRRTWDNWGGGTGVRNENGTHSRSNESRRMVVLCDELEAAPGDITRRKPEASAKGHNGIKSVQASMKSAGKNVWERIQVGIGRPKSRESNDVAVYVLSKIPSQLLETIDGRADEVIDICFEIADRNDDDDNE